MISENLMAFVKHNVDMDVEMGTWDVPQTLVLLFQNKGNIESKDLGVPDDVWEQVNQVGATILGISAMLMMGQPLPPTLVEAIQAPGKFMGVALFSEAYGLVGKAGVKVHELRTQGPLHENPDSIEFKTVLFVEPAGGNFNYLRTRTEHELDGTVNEYNIGPLPIALHTLAAMLDFGRESGVLVER